MQRRSGIAAILTVCSFSAAQAAEKKVHIYDGITVQQIMDFADRQGWSARKSSVANAVDLKVASRRFTLRLSNCSTKNVCVSGLLEARRSGGKPPTLRAVTWANKRLGATIYYDGQFVVRRLLTFRGVTDVYLREAIRYAWVEALPVFDRTVGAFDTR